MAKIQINKAVTSKYGMTVPSGAIIGPSTTFPFNTMNVEWYLKIWASQSDLDGNKEFFQIEEIKEPFIVKEMTQEEYDSLAGANALGIVMQWLKDYLLTLNDGAETPTYYFEDADLTIIP